MNSVFVSDIKRFAVHDGDGIRTTVFLKGCPLKCVWCHNPESLSFRPQVAFYRHKCIECGECGLVCPENAHVFDENGHIYRRNLCIACGKCEEFCLGDALKQYGKEMTVEELMPLLLEDREFFESSGGGITLSGGECLMHADFCAALLKRCKEEGLRTAVDTCGFVPRESLEKVIPYTDVFLYDVKAMDEAVHIRCTGQSNRIILDNLRYLNEKNCPVEVRIPYVPGWNDDQMEKIASFLSTLPCVTGVRVLAYHNFAGSKYDALEMENTLPDTLPESGETAAAEEIMRSYGLTVK